MVPQHTQYVNQLTDWIFSHFGEIAWWKRSSNLPQPDCFIFGHLEATLSRP